MIFPATVIRIKLSARVLGYMRLLQYYYRFLLYSLMITEELGISYVFFFFFGHPTFR